MSKKCECYCEWCRVWRPVEIKVRRTLMYRPALKREFNGMIEYFREQIRLRDEEINEIDELKKN